MFIILIVILYPLKIYPPKKLPFFGTSHENKSIINYCIVAKSILIVSDLINASGMDSVNDDEYSGLKIEIS